MNLELQQRLTEGVEKTPEQIIAESELSEIEQKIFALRQAEAAAQLVAKERDALKEGIRQLVADSQCPLGSEVVGWYELVTPTPTETFNYRGAMEDGLFNRKQAEPYIGYSTPTPRLTFKRTLKEKK